MRSCPAGEKLEEEMMGMVEDVLKSEAPKDEFAERVLEVLSRRRPRDAGLRMPWRELVAELKRIGSRGIQGFARALESPHSPTRVAATALIRTGESHDTKETVIELLKRALGDPNKKVRRNAVDAILRIDLPGGRRREELMPLVLTRLGDVATRVRRRAAYCLSRQAADVPWEPAARALLRERDPITRKFMEELLRAILDARQGGAESS